MVAPLFGLASLAACVALARLLHPGRPAVAAMAPLARSQRAWTGRAVSRPQSVADATGS